MFFLCALLQLFINGKSIVSICQEESESKDPMTTQHIVVVFSMFINKIL